MPPGERYMLFTNDDKSNLVCDRLTSSERMTVYVYDFGHIQILPNMYQNDLGIIPMIKDKNTNITGKISKLIDKI